MAKSKRKQPKNFRKLLCEKGKLHFFGNWYVPIIKLDSFDAYNFTEAELKVSWNELAMDNPYNNFKLFAHKHHIKKKCIYCGFTVAENRTNDAYPYEDLIINGRSYTYHTHGQLKRTLISKEKKYADKRR